MTNRWCCAQGSPPRESLLNLKHHRPPKRRDVSWAMRPMMTRGKMTSRMAGAAFFRRPRHGISARQLRAHCGGTGRLKFDELVVAHGGDATSLYVSTVSISELLHGAHRANTEARRLS